MSLQEYKFPDSYEQLRAAEQLNKLRIISNELNLSEKSILLDIGCGTGLSRKVFNCNIVGVDPEPALLRKAPLHKSLARAESLPFKDKTFDAVIAVTSLHNVEDIHKALAEIKRVGRGKFAFTILRKSQKHDSIVTDITRLFNITDIIEEKADTILVQH